MQRATFSLACLLATAPVSIGRTAVAATFSADFSSGLMPALWTVVQTTPDLWSVDPTPGDVRFAKLGSSPGGFQAAAVQLDLAHLGGPIAGAFATQIHFGDAAVGPSTDQVESHANFQDGSFFFLVDETGPNVHVWIGSQQGTTVVAGNSGTFRIERTGNT